MGATRLMNGLAGSSGRARRRTAVPQRARRTGGPLTVAAGGALVLGVLSVPASASVSPGAAGRTPAPATATCALGPSGSSVKHVIYLQFDNVHYTRDNPN